MENLLLEKCILLGHSMGGKTAMQFALEHGDLLDKLIVVDMAPKYYPPHHQAVLQGLQAVDFTKIQTRKEAETILSQYIDDAGTKQFLLKNIVSCCQKWIFVIILPGYFKTFTTIKRDELKPHLNYVLSYIYDNFRSKSVICTNELKRLEGLKKEPNY
jgi:pimeloyl-ACP methyl ester carboxylesterase